MSRESFDEYMRRVRPPRRGINYARYLNGPCNNAELWGRRVFPNASAIVERVVCAYHTDCTLVEEGPLGPLVHPRQHVVLVDRLAERLASQPTRRA